MNKVIKCSSNNGNRYKSPLNGDSFISCREIWARAIPAAARKATATGVNWIAIDEDNGKFYIYQVSGYTHDSGLFNFRLNEKGQIIA